MEASPVWSGFVGSLAAGSATVAGALPMMLVRSVRPQAQAVMTGFGAGVMLAATCFSLLVPGLAAAMRATDSQLGAALLVAGGMLLGAGALWLGNRFSPHEHFVKGVEGAVAARLRRLWLFIIAITIHNFPEGMTIGVGFGSGDAANGTALAIGMGLQNVPEGLVVASALLAVGYSRPSALAVALATGLVEPIGGLFGAGAVTLAHELLPWGLAFAAGAMLFVVSDEVIPESHRLGIEKEGTFGLMVGFVSMMVLEAALA